jgi:hypothetical protein
MSANRSVQAAQRRRAGPAEPQQTQRGPNTSINSAAAFSKQPQNIPSGKLAGQHASLAQQNYMAEQKAEMKQQQSNPKISVAKAITLLSLRMGRMETIVNNILSGEHPGNINISSNGENSFQLENAILEDIVHRLEDLEKQPKQQYSGASLNTSADTASIKQQLDAHTKIIKQTELATISVVKNYQNIKTVIDNVKNDLLDTKNALNAIQQITDDHDSKIKQMETNIGSSFGILANDDNNAEDFDLNNLEFNEDEDLLNADINMAAIVEDDEDVEEEN